MPAWPATLPQFVEVQGFKEKPAPNVLRTPMETGPAKQRRRTTAGAAPISVAILLTRAQAATFTAFIETDLEGGALAFDWVHPRTQNAASFRVVNGDYEITAASPSFFLLRMDMEELP